MTNLIFVIFTQ